MYPAAASGLALPLGGVDEITAVGSGASAFASSVTAGSRRRRALAARGRPQTHIAATSMNTEALSILGRDALMFLAATVSIVPACKRLNISPVLGFLAAGAVLGPSGFSVIRDLSELDTLGELGISFLLFEQGLELSLDRLKALSKYAFGLGTLQASRV